MSSLDDLFKVKYPFLSGLFPYLIRFAWKHRKEVTLTAIRNPPYQEANGSLAPVEIRVRTTLWLFLTHILMVERQDI